MTSEDISNEMLQLLRRDSIVTELAERNQISLEEFKPEIYTKVPLNTLLLVSLLLISRHRNADPLKNIVRMDDWYVQTFFAFPLRWMISPRWPIMTHTEKMNKRWRDLRDNGLITGTAKDGFVITDAGLKNALIALQVMRTNTTDNVEVDLTSIDRAVLRRFTAQRIYKEWDGETLPPALSLQELAQILKISPASPIEVYRKNLLNSIKKRGLLDYSNVEFTRARRFLTLQACYYNDIMGMGNIEYHKLLNRVLKELDIEKLGKIAKNKQIRA